jgi:hypothetical protein
LPLSRTITQTDARIDLTASRASGLKWAVSAPSFSEFEEELFKEADDDVSARKKK